jgi:two-component system, LytTR family, sensor kinase
MNQVQTKPTYISLAHLIDWKWFVDERSVWYRRVFGWIVFALVMRFVVIEKTYKDNELVNTYLSINLFLQTISLYYFFGYYIFPKYLYTFFASPFLLWFLCCYVTTYQINYWLISYLTQINSDYHIEKDWKLLQNAGWYGFFFDSGAAFFNFFYSFPFALILLIVRAAKDISSLRTRNLVLEKDKLNLELNFLKSQVNPHFLFNTLNSIYSRVFDIDEKSADLVLRLSDLMRYNLYETDLPRIGLEKELNYVQSYLDLERNRLSDQYVVIEYEQTGRPELYQITPLLLIAFVENAFKHGVKGTAEPTYVYVNADIVDSQLIFRVENSVPPRRIGPISTAVKLGGIGLANVRRRLDELYRNRHSLVIEPAEGIYVVTLTVQVEAATYTNT